MSEGLRDKFKNVSHGLEGEVRTTATRDDVLPVLGVAVLVVVGALWIVGTVDLQFVGSDQLVPVFASLYHWTPFFWGQTRFGMAIPLLAAPIANPVANLVTQRAIGHVLGLLFPFLLARWLLGPQRWLVAGALGATTLVLALGPFMLHFIVIPQPYIVSATPAVAGTLLLGSARLARRVAGWVLLAIAFWITPSTLLWLAPMLFLRGLAPEEGDGSSRRANWALGMRLALVSGLAMALAGAGRLVSGVTPTPLGLAPAQDWPATWGKLSSGVFEHLPAGWPILIAAIPLGLALAESLHQAPEAITRSRRILSALGIGAAAQLLGAGTFLWVAQGKSTPTEWRFAIPSIVFLLLAPPLSAAALLPAGASGPARSGGRRRWVALLVLALPLVALALALGAPSRSRASAALEKNARFGLHLDPLARELVDRRATHLLAPYWLAYPIAFRANCRLHAGGDRRTVWPIALRAEAARDFWEPADWSTARIAVLRELPAARAGAPLAPADLESDRKSLRLPELELVESGELFDIYRGHGAAPVK